MNKKHLSVWVDEEIVKRCDANIEIGKAKSRSEFIEDAIEFYIGYLHSETSEEYISRTLMRVINSRNEASEERICRLLFKQAVESSKIFWTLAQNLKMDIEAANALHDECVKEVMATNGRLRTSYKGEGGDK